MTEIKTEGSFRNICLGPNKKLLLISKRKVSLNIMASIKTQRRVMRGQEKQLNTDWVRYFFSSFFFFVPLMKYFNLAARELCLRPSPVTSSDILSSVWGERARTPLQGKLIFTEDAVHRCTNLHEIWLPFINQDEYAPVHQRCLPSEFVVFPACWLEANSINHTTIPDLTWLLTLATALSYRCGAFFRF